jgi:hypothetical protein
MKIVRAVDVSPNDWDEACERSSGAWLFHLASWVALEERYFNHRSLSFALVEGERVLGVQPLYVTEVGIGWIERLVHCGIHRHTGLALVDGLPPEKQREAWTLAMRAVHTAAAAEDADRIQLNTQNLAPVNLSDARDEIPVWVREYGFHLGMNFGPGGMFPVPGMATCCADQIVALAPDEAALFAGLDDGCRRAVRKAEKAGVEFEPASPNVLEDYWRLAQAGALRTGEQLPAREYYATLVEQFAPAGRCQVLFARHQGQRVAGLLLAIDKGAVSFLGGVSHPDALPLRVNDFIHWSAIRWARHAGHHHYRFGPAFPEVPRDWPIATVSRFKEKFGARSFTTIQGSSFLKPEKYLAGAVSHLSLLCAARPETASGDHQ